MNKPLITLLYDDNCTLCRRKMLWLIKNDKHGKIKLVDVNSPQFALYNWSLADYEVNKNLYGVLADGTRVKNLRALRYAYQAIGKTWIIAPCLLPGLALFCEYIYRLIRNNRYLISKFIR